MRIAFRQKDVILFQGFFILTMAGSTWAHVYGIEDELEYVAYAILLSCILMNFITSTHIERKRHKILLFLLVTFCMTIGLCLQNLALSTLFTLIMTMLAICISSMLSEDYLQSFQKVKTASNAILCGTIVSFLIAVTFGYSVGRSHSEIISGYTYAFSSGMYIKNIFGAEMVVVFIGNYFAERYEKRTIGHKIIMVYALLMLLLSNSRGALIMLIVFLISMSISILRRIERRQRKPFVITLMLLCSAVIVVLYQEYALNSFNYMMRITGFFNYINDNDTDLIRLLLGNAKELYGSELDYVTQFRAIYGWDGTCEFALLNILIKNGLVGLAGYIIIFYKLISSFLKSNNWKYKTAGVAVAMMLLISALVEDYISNIHTPVGFFCYLIMGGIVGMSVREHKMICL